MVDFSAYPPVGHRLTPRGTPLHVYQLTMKLLELTFAEVSTDPAYPFTYTQDPATTGLFITSVFDKTASTYGAKPVVLVTRGAMSTRPQVMGDRAKADIDMLSRKGLTLVRSSVDVKVIAERPSEVDIIANEVFSFLTTCRTVLPGLTGIHQIEGASSSQVNTFEDADHLFFVQMEMPYVMPYKWDWAITPTLLGQIGLYINDELRIDLS